MNNKRSIFRLTIIDVGYSSNVDNSRTVKCKTTYRNPITNQIQIATATAKCHPNDEFNYVTGMRIAESRAKNRMYTQYINFIRNITNEVIYKHSKLQIEEASHLENIISQLR